MGSGVCYTNYDRYLCHSACGHATQAHNVLVLQAPIIGPCGPIIDHYTDFIYQFH